MAAVSQLVESSTFDGAGGHAALEQRHLDLANSAADLQNRHPSWPEVGQQIDDGLRRSLGNLVGGNVRRGPWRLCEVKTSS